MNRYWLAVIAGIGASFTIGLLSLIEANIDNAVLIMAPFGATAVLVFGVSSSPLAQPKNVILGHFITAFIGVFFYQYLELNPVTISI
jgi:CBS-domain-containing membrane protein